MTVGLEIYDALGNPILSVGDRVGRFLLQTDTGGSNGSYSVIKKPGDGDIFYYMRQLSSNYYMPRIWLSGGNVVNWDYVGMSQPYCVNCRIFIGVF